MLDFDVETEQSIITRDSLCRKTHTICICSWGAFMKQYSGRNMLMLAGNRKEKVWNIHTFHDCAKKVTFFCFWFGLVEAISNPRLLSTYASRVRSLIASLPLDSCMKLKCVLHFIYFHVLCEQTERGTLSIMDECFFLFLGLDPCGHINNMSVNSNIPLPKRMCDVRNAQRSAKEAETIIIPVSGRFLVYEEVRER